MRRIVYLITIMLFIFVCCEEQEDEVSTYYWGNSTALKNGANWNSEAIHTYYNVFHLNNIDFFMEVYNSHGEMREDLYFFNIPISFDEKQIYNVKNNTDNQFIGAAYTTLSHDGDVVEDRFVVLEDENSFIQLESINSKTNEIKGKFQITLVRDTSDRITNPSLPDTVRFTNGNFHIKIVD